MFPFGACPHPGLVETLLTLVSVSQPGPLPDAPRVCRGTTLAQFVVASAPSHGGVLTKAGCPPHSKNPACWDPGHPGYPPHAPAVALVSKDVTFACPKVATPLAPGVRLAGKYWARTFVLAHGEERCRQGFNATGIVIPQKN